MADCNNKRLQTFKEDECSSSSDDCGCGINDIKWTGSAACWGISAGNSLGTVLTNIMARAVIDRGDAGADVDCDCAVSWIAMEDAGVIQLCGDVERGVGSGIEFQADGDLRIFSDDGDVIIEDRLFLNGGLRIFDADTVDATDPIQVTEEQLFYPVNANGGDFTVALTVGVKGVTYVISRVDTNAAQTVTVEPDGSETIEGLTSYNLKPRETIWITYSDKNQGNEWKIIARQWQPTGLDTSTTGSATVVDKRLIGLSVANFMLFVDGQLQISGIHFNFTSATGTITWIITPASSLNLRLTIF